MKTLLLLRHAKSNWDDPGLSDHDRPLKRRGINAARQIGKLMCDQKLLPELVVCSTAVRARETLELVLESSKRQPVVEFTEQLYHCPPTEFMAVLQQVDESVSTVMLVGHNPGLEEFLSMLTGSNQLMPTGTLAKVELKIEHWSQLADDSSSRLIHLWRPRDLEND